MFQTVCNEAPEALKTECLMKKSATFSRVHPDDIVKYLLHAASFCIYLFCCGFVSERPPNQFFFPQTSFQVYAGTLNWPQTLQWVHSWVPGEQVPFSLQSGVSLTAAYHLISSELKTGHLIQLFLINANGGSRWLSVVNLERRKKNTKGLFVRLLSSWLETKTLGREKGESLK